MTQEPVVQKQVIVQKESPSAGTILAGGAVVGLLLLNPLTWIVGFFAMLLAAYAMILLFYGGTLGTVAILSVIESHPFLVGGTLTLLILVPLVKEAIVSKERIKILEQKLAQLEQKGPLG